MKINQRKNAVARMMNVSRKRVWVDPSRLKDVKDSITKEDLRNLIGQGIIKIKQAGGVSRARARHILKQKRKGSRKGYGSKKGRKTARSNPKELWINKVRSQRRLLKQYRNTGKIERKVYSELYNKVKGGFFRSTRHIAIYLKDRNLYIVKK